MLHRPISFDTSINPNEGKELQDDEKKMGIMKFVDIFMFLGFVTTLASFAFIHEYVNFSVNNRKYEYYEMCKI